MIHGSNCGFQGTGTNSMVNLVVDSINGVAAISKYDWQNTHCDHRGERKTKGKGQMLFDTNSHSYCWMTTYMVLVIGHTGPSTGPDS